MLQCSECGAENRVSGIFCHSCGAKLDLDSIQPPVPDAGKGKKGGKGRLLRNLIALVLLLGVAAVLVCIFLSVPMPVKTDFEGHTQRNLLKKAKAASSGGYSGELRFTSQELTFLANKKWNLVEEDSEGEGTASGAALVPKELNVMVKPQNVVKVVLRSRVFDKLTAYSTMVVRLKPENGKLGYDVVRVNAGRVPLFGPFSKKLMERFPFYDAPVLEKLAENIKEVETKPDALTIKVN